MCGRWGAGVTARDSGAGSMVNHARHIAIAGPLDHRLLFERSVSVRWRSLPDIGIDVESARRLEFYDRIFERYGAERVAVSAEYRNLPDPTRAALSYQAQRVGAAQAFGSMGWFVVGRDGRGLVVRSCNRLLGRVRR
ncbi:hypothetical protein AB0M57_25555 [Streptomyces sp. NPDC051597]|uniref:hypothetical protein n=1 Tax=Streptomyces sp. NPDC051597 TaxID=3155049 RepID=UPI0034273220